MRRSRRLAWFDAAHLHLHAAGDLPQACEAWQQALANVEDLDRPGAGTVRAKLAARTAPSGSSTSA